MGRAWRAWSASAFGLGFGLGGGCEGGRWVRCARRLDPGDVFQFLHVPPLTRGIVYRRGSAAPDGAVL